MPKLMSIELMYAILDVISQSYRGVPASEEERQELRLDKVQPPTVAEIEALSLVEIRPRSETFADEALTCSVSPNDPADPDGWMDEEAFWPGDRYVAYSPRQIMEMGVGQLLVLRYVIDFTLFFNELGVNRSEATIASQWIIGRLHNALMLAGEVHHGRFAQIGRDDLGTNLIRSQNCVKKRRMIPRGSSEEVIYRGKMWLQFETYMNP